MLAAEPVAVCFVPFNSATLCKEVQNSGSFPSRNFWIAASSTGLLEYFIKMSYYLSTTRSLK